MADDVKAIATKLKGKKAKLKALDEEATGTKATKLPKDVAKGLEEVLGAKLNKVRVHTGGNAGDLCKKLGAKAFTHGSDIYFAKPGYAKDNRLLAHELTHVVQQAQGKVPKPQKGKVLVTK
ncbi:MAG: DUF4157 domain-containing protein [Tateyamaria sp.]